MRVIAIFVKPGVSISATNKQQKIKWQGLTVPLPPNIIYDDADAEGALRAHQYCCERFTKLKGKAPTNVEFVEKF